MLDVCHPVRHTHQRRPATALRPRNARARGDVREANLVRQGSWVVGHQHGANYSGVTGVVAILDARLGRAVSV